MTTSTLRVFAALVLLAGQAVAGLLDDPPPALPGGGQSRVVFRMGPVHYTPGGVDTVITCTNAGTAAAAVAVELYAEDDVGRSAIAFRDAVAPGASVTFATSAAEDRPGASVFPGIQPIEHGKARVSASTSKLSCDAQHVIPSVEAGGLPKRVPLELIKRVSFDDE
jgi:hypothetical protein